MKTSDKYVPYDGDTLWGAVFGVIPSYRTAVEAGVLMNRPACVRDALLDALFRLYEGVPNGQERYYLNMHVAILASAHWDIQNIGYFVFKDEVDEQSTDA